MEFLELIKVLGAPAAVSVVTVVVAMVVLVRYLEKWRTELLSGLVVEVKRDLKNGAPEVRITSPLITSPEDVPVRKSVFDLHHHHIDDHIRGLNSRVERLERKLDDDVKRLHERVDELPQRIIELLKPLLKH